MLRHDARSTLGFARLAFAGALAACLAILPARAEWIGESQGDYEDSRDHTFSGSTSRVLFPLADGGRVLPSRVSAAGPAGSMAAALPERAPVIDQDRLDLSGLPLADQVLTKPLASFLRPRYRVGTVLRSGDALVVALDPAIAGEHAAELLSRPIALLTRAPLSNDIVALALPAMAPAGGAPAPSGPAIGAAYDAGDQLLLSPPRSMFYGLDPLFD